MFDPRGQTTDNQLPQQGPTLELQIHDTQPPSACGRMTICQATLALVSLMPSPPDHKKFRTILLS